MSGIYVNAGIYSIQEAARLTGLGESRVRRWLSGYTYTTSGQRRKALPVWSGQLAPIKGRRVVSFRDLIEMKFVDAFLRAGVSWKVIRTVQELARKQFSFDHPFSTNRFRTDGSHLVMTAMREDKQSTLFDIATRQQIFLGAAVPFREELDMNGEDSVLRWWPLGRKRNVVLDPARSWGRPLIPRTGLPTAVIRHALNAGATASGVASWFELSEAELRDAEEFEKLSGGGT